MSENLFSLFANAIPDPGRALLLPGPREEISFRRAFDCAGRFAHLLASRGVKRGDRVAVQVEKSPEAVFLYFACLRLGAIYVPFNPAYTADELAYLLSNAGPALFVCAPEKETAARTVFPQGPILTLGADGKTGSLIQQAKNLPTDFPDANMAGKDLAAILYTSGTTGRSKGAMLSHGNLKSNALALKALWQFSDKDVLLHVLPIFHTHGLFVAMNVALAAASSIIFLPKFNPDEIFHQLPRATTMMGVAHAWWCAFCPIPRLSTRAAVSPMRLFVLQAPAPLPIEIFTQWQERTGFTRAGTLWRMTENQHEYSPIPMLARGVPGTVGLPRCPAPRSGSWTRTAMPCRKGRWE